MSSLKEKIKHLDRLVIEFNECQTAIIEIKINGITVSEKLITVEAVSYNPQNKESDISISFREVKNTNKYTNIKTEHNV